jgi:hypothetical protein
MRPDPGLQTWQDAIHLIAFVRGRAVAGTHCGLVLPVVPEDLSGRVTCVRCFQHWAESDDALDGTAAEDPVGAATAPASPAGCGA